MSVQGSSSFSPRAVLALVLFGSLVFVALLWMIGAGVDGREPNDGGAHVGGKGLNGYAAIADLLERHGFAVTRSRSEAALDDIGLLVITPLSDADPKKIDKVIEARRNIGPTLVILPKWQAIQLSPGPANPQVRKGWVLLEDFSPPKWVEKSAALGPLTIDPLVMKDAPSHWTGLGREGLRAPGKITQFMDGQSIQSLVSDGEARALAGYVDDGDYPDLADAAGVRSGDGNDENRYPLVIVAEPDLLNNYGFADKERAMLALELIELAAVGENAINFDLTIPGYGRSANLLTLAFTPPFLAATLCLLLAALAVGWRAFNRFGPPRVVERAIAFGKRALVSNAAGLIRRTGRLHLITAPYADAARERLARALALPHHADTAQTEAAIDRALAARAPNMRPFSILAAELRTAHRPHDMLRSAQDLNTLERMLKR
jgi:hypothetical protein